MLFGRIGVGGVCTKMMLVNAARSVDRVRFEELEKRQLLAGIYFVSPTGHDANDGRSHETAWRTIDRANQRNWNAGDRLLFQGGNTYAVQGVRGENFLTNPGFEDGFAGWTDTMGTSASNSAIVTDPTNVHGETSALALGT